MSNDVLVRGSFLTKDELDAEYKERKKEIFKQSIPIDQDIPDGWKLLRKYIQVQHIFQEKRIGQYLEDKVWKLFYDLGSEAISTNDLTLQIRKKSDLQKTKQIDVIAIDNDFVFIVECKSKEKLGKKSLKKDISELIVNKKVVENSLKSLLENRQITFVHIIATENIVWNENDKVDAKDAGFLIWNEYDLMVLQDLANLAGEGAKYQIYNRIFSGKQIKGFNKKVPALKSKMGGHTFYTFNMVPEDLLKIAYVHRRTGTTSFSNITKAYQRVIKKSRIQKIEEFIEEGGIFPGAIILNFHRNFPKEEIIGSKSHLDQLDDCSKPVAITIPPYYGCAWIIDGQHRLYGFSDSDKKFTETLPIVAYVGEDVSFEANLFVDINQNQKPIDSNLLWDLYEDLYDGSRDEKEMENYSISKIAKGLNSLKDSPFLGNVKIPKEQNKGNLTLTTICTTLKRLHLISKDDGKLFNKSYEESIDFAVDRISVFFENIRKELPEEWEAGDKHYIRTNSGFVVIAGILREIIDTNLTKAEINDIKEFQKRTYKYIEPVLFHLLKVDQETIDSYRGAGGAGQKSRQVLIELLKKIREADIGFSSRLLEKYEESKEQEDEFEKLKKGVKYYLEKNEGEMMEFKGSTSFDVDNYFRGDGKQKKNNKLADEGVLKSIVGLLNTYGGDVLVGVLELDKYQDIYEDKLLDCPLAEDKIILGINIEYGKDNWDGYQLRLIELIETRVDSDVLDTQLVKISKLEYDEYDLCLIEVSPSDTKKYLNQKDFYIRRGNKTQKLVGPDIDKFWSGKDSK